MCLFNSRSFLRIVLVTEVDDELDGDRVQTMHAKSALSALMLAIVCRMKTTVSLNI